MEFRHRRKRKTEINVDTYKDYPVIDKYKYLGTWFSNKLELVPQTQFIEKKVYFMRQKLSPCLHNASLEFRKNLWQVFVVPLFEFTLPIYFAEKAVTNREGLELTLRKSFKIFTGLAKGVKTKVIDELMGYNLEERSKYVEYISRKKWEHRLKGEKYSPYCDPNKELAIPPNKTNKCKYFSKEMIKYINLQTAICPKCKEINPTQICSGEHLETDHAIKIDSVDCIIDQLNQTSQKEVINKKNKKVKKYKTRDEMIQNFKDILDPNYRRIKQFFLLCN